MPTTVVGVKHSSTSVYLSVCPQLYSKTNDPKVFKLGIGNQLWISESESECKCLTCNQKPTESQFSLLHEPN